MTDDETTKPDRPSVLHEDTEPTPPFRMKEYPVNFIDQARAFISGDAGVKAAAALVAIAAVVRSLTPPWTLAHKIADQVIAFGAAHAIGVTSARAQKD